MIVRKLLKFLGYCFIFTFCIFVFSNVYAEYKVNQNIKSQFSQCLLQFSELYKDYIFFKSYEKIDLIDLNEKIKACDANKHDETKAVSLKLLQSEGINQLSSKLNVNRFNKIWSNISNCVFSNLSEYVKKFYLSKPLPNYFLTNIGARFLYDQKSSICFANQSSALIKDINTYNLVANIIMRIIRNENTYFLLKKQEVNEKKFISLLLSNGMVWVMVQHADDHPKFQEDILEVMLYAWEHNRTGKSDNIAYLTDRVQMKKDDTQIYGTQIDCDEYGEAFISPPLKYSLNKTELLWFKLNGKSLMNIVEYYKSSCKTFGL